MKYADLVSLYELLAETDSTLRKTETLADALASADEEHRGMLVVMIRGKVFANWRSKELGVSSSLTKDAIENATGIPGSQIEDWWREEGDLGDAAARAIGNKTQQTLFKDSLTVTKVYSTIRELAEYKGTGSQERRVKVIAGLLSSASPVEGKYLVRTVAGAMRIGVGEGIIRDAIAEAFLDGTEGAVDAVERAYDVTNDYGLVASKAAVGETAALEALDIEVFRPIKPMLAHKAESMESALSSLGDDSGDVLLEAKYDGIRAKVHGDTDDVRMFTRRLEDVTAQFPDVIEAVEDAVTADRFILEAEVVGYDPETGDVVPFQKLSQRIKRKYDIEEMAEEVPVTVFVFDSLLIGEDSLLEQPLHSRLARVDGVISPLDKRIERASHMKTASLDEADSFYESTVADGQEGVMMKNLEAPYQPGSRVGYQLKLKETLEPIDLVVTRAKWSEGRKSDFLGRPYLACYDEESEDFREVGRMHTGFTDKQLKEFTDLVEPYIRSIDGREADFEPKVVLEVEFEEIQESPKYNSGYALRFPRLSRLRRDLGPEDADSFSKIQSLYKHR